MKERSKKVEQNENKKLKKTSNQKVKKIKETVKAKNPWLIVENSQKKNY